MKRKILCLAALCSGLAAHAAEARSVYLNGFDISEIRDQTFEKAKVTIDKDGNIRIDAPQYDIKVVPPASNALNDRGGPNTALKNKYFLVTQPSAGGKTQYDFLVSVNGTDRRLIKADAPQLILEISAWLKKGENKVVITAKKNIVGGRRSFSAQDKATAIIGVGSDANKIVKIERIKAEVQVDGSTVDNIEKHFLIVVE